MRVALVCPYSLAVPGGVQQQVTGLARALTRLGCEAEILAPGAASRARHGAGVIDVGRAFGFRVNGSIAPMAPHPAAAVRTVRALRRGRYDVVHLHEPLAPSITIPALAGWPGPFVGTFHAAGDRTPYRWAAPVLRRLAGRLDATVAVSAAAAGLAHRHLGASCTVLFNGLDTDGYGDAAPEPTDGPTVLFLGRHEPRKGLDVLLDAVGRLPPDVRVWIVGDGPDTARLRRRYGSDRRVRWLGRLSDPDKVRHLRAASVLCAPSRHGESFGLVLLEAMAAGLPVVASDLPGYRAVGDEGRAARLVPPGDAAALAAALGDVLFGVGGADRLRAGGLQVAERYSMAELARRYIDVYEDVCRRRRRTR